MAADIDKMNCEFKDHFYGRRKSRKLRTHKRYLMDEYLPKIQLTNISDLKSHKTIWLEIGFGGGEHLAEMAARHPEIQFIGCEVFENGIASLLQHMVEKKLSNIAIYPEDVRPFLRTFPPAFIDKAFILFPDPWPKKKHLERRLVQKDFLLELLRIMKPAAEIRFASDHEDYVQGVEVLVKNSEAFSQIYVYEEKPLSWPMTIYNQKALAKGTPSWYLEAHRK